ncbi:MAG: hypothetical protein IT495_00650 [Gammaproteobacteria bacterium]|nr:hypothetical protein [Gammaproteobacteria bacterium]
MGNTDHDRTASIRQQLERVLASSVFAHASRQSRFLRFVVEETLAGRDDRLKGYTIGVEVFDRDAGFDPSTDSIVRVEAGRLRAKLREYYETEGRGDSIRIELPKGGYAARISPPETHHDGNVPAGTRTVAVLPFVNLSDASEDAYFADGLTDALINHLARNRALSVTSFTSAMRFKRAARSLADIADALGVDRVVEGTVLRAGRRVRVTAQLIDAATDHHLWAESFERDLTDVLAVQEDLASAVSLALGVGLLGAEHGRRQVGIEAYEANLLGRHYRTQLTAEALEKGIACFRRALELEPDYAEAYAGLAGCYCSLGTLGVELRAPHDVLPQGMALARRAIELDERFVEGRAYLGIMLLKYAWDWDGARAQFERALALSPNDARALMQYSMYFETLGDHARAIDLAVHAQRVDPLSRPVNLNLGWQYHQAGEQALARSTLTQLTAIEAGFWGAWWALGHVHREAGEHERAVECMRRALELPGGNTLPLEGLGHTLAVAGERTAAEAIITELQALPGYVSPYRIATVLAGLGRREAMYAQLERAFDKRARSLAWLAVAREYRAYRDEAAFGDLLYRIGIPGHGR